VPRPEHGRLEDGRLEEEHTDPRGRPVTDALDASAAIIPILAAVLTSASYVLVGTTIDLAAVVLCASGAFLVYLWDRAWGTSPEDATNRPTRLGWHERNPAYRYWATSLAIALAVASWFLAPPLLKTVAAGLAVIGIIHHTSVGGVRPKAHPILKPTLVGLAWGIGCSLPPILTGHVTALALVPAVALIRTLTVSANAVVSDLHDVEGDVRAGVASLATLKGPTVTRGVATLLLLLASVVAVSMWSQTSSPLWLVEGFGLLAFAWMIRPGRDSPPSRLTLDLLVGFPAVTLLASLIF
jgi:4-hydroxybenzoate polyprenyltransferase